MYLVDRQDDRLKEMAQTLRGLTEKILSNLDTDQEVVHLSSTDDVFGDQPLTRIFLVKSGRLYCRRDHKIVYVVEPGDLVGLSRSLQLPEGPFSCDEPAELLPFSRDAIVAHVNSNDKLQKHWAFYLLCRSSFFSECLAKEIRGQFTPTTGFLSFEAGDVIINQGDQADCVYTLLEGSADAYRDQIKVGEINAEEIFGAMAVFTDQPRTASVIATSSCSVLAVRKEEFLELVAEQPQVCRSLIEEMAEKINQLNQQITSLQK